MANQMLVDATHPEETRVVVVRGNRVEEFDFESANRKQLRGNIYLAKVTRVEPSLQAAFVDYGGNRHGFLAFSEIHPDYYQIPVADRQALLEEEKGHDADDADHDDGVVEAASDKTRAEQPDETSADSSKKSVRATLDEDAIVEPEADAQSAVSEDEPAMAVPEETDASADTGLAPLESASDDAVDGADDEPEEPVISYEGDAAALTAAALDTTDDSDDDEDGGEMPPAQAHAVAAGESISADPEDIPEAEALDDEEAVSFDAPDLSEDDDEEGDDGNAHVEHVGAEDALEEVPERRSRRRTRQYKIQEVIKRRQILLVQVVKEERGNKGAALTTYLSLAGRYSVLMPNTARGGGISRKITNVSDRKRLKQIASDLEVADGMGVILRTAGASRTKTEIKRDFEYLLRLWENVRDLTLKSAAPLLVYEEGSLIKRSIRDLYNKDIDQVLVSGEEGYKEAKGFMRMLMPSHARNVQPYREPQPIFTRMGIESQLDAMFSPQVTLKSGGYIVIDQTEALVSIDVNSGRSTREHNIEDTALSTNLEAAEEISRQLRLRDLAGLVVIDFIDMEEKRNNRSVEKRLKECLKSDRARIQVGRISHFGLMEMSRQRIRTGVLESTMDPCPHCHGTGYVRAAASVALLVLRTIEDHLLKGVTHHMVVKTRTNVALYILNQKRQNLFELENRFGVNISIEVDDQLEGKHLEIERGDPLEQPIAPTPTVSMLATDDLDEDLAFEEEEREREREEESSSKKRRRRRRRKKGSQADSQGNVTESEETGKEADEAEASDQKEAKGEEDGDDKPKKGRRRGRRGGRRNRRNRQTEGETDNQAQSAEASDGETAEAAPEYEGADEAASSDDTAGDTVTTIEIKVASSSDAESSDVNDGAEEESSEAALSEDDGEAEEVTVSAALADTTASENDADSVAPVISEEATDTEPAELDAPESGQSDMGHSEETQADETHEAGLSEESTDSSEAEPIEAAIDEDTVTDASEEQSDIAETVQEAPEMSDEVPADVSDEAPVEEPVKEVVEEKAKPKRTGWWNRSGFL